MPSERPIRILHVDDEENQLEFTKIFLEQIDQDVEIDSVLTPEEALKLHKKGSYDCVVSDYKMMTMNGIELAQKVRENSNVPFILYTGQGSEEVAEKAFNAGVDDYLRKEAEPTHYQVLAKRIRHSVEKHRTDELYRKVVEESREAIVILKDNKIQFLNQSACELLELESKEKGLGREIFEFIPDNREKFVPPQEGVNITFEAQFARSYGSEKSVEVSISKTNYLGEESALVFIRDITQRTQNTDRLNAIYQQAVRLSSTKNIQEISEITLDIMESIFIHNTITFYFVENETLRPIGVRGNQNNEIEISLFEKGIVAKAARKLKSILIKDSKLSNKSRRTTNEVRSELAVPAVHNSKTMAVLYVESQKDIKFTEDDRKLLETLTYHVAFALNKILQLEAVERLEEKKRDKLDDALGRLDNAEKIDTLVRGALQKNILNIQNASSILQENISNIGPILKTIDISAENAQKISKQIRNAISDNVLESGLIEANLTMRKIIGQMTIPRNLRINTQYATNLLLIEIEENIFSRILTNLINNSIEAMPRGGTLSIKVSSDNEHVFIEIKDTGSGIEKQIIPKLFQPFNTTKKGHSGIGLAFSKNAVESSGGTLKLKSTSEKGTIFSIKFPLLRKI